MLKYIRLIIATALFCRVLAVCKEGNIRLENGPENEGRVEVCSNSMWGTVCNDYWDNSDAVVVCRQLGHNPYGAQAIHGPQFGLGVGSIVLDNVRCDSSEATLLDCTYTNLTDFGVSQVYSRCRYGGGAGVRCRDHLINNATVAVVDAPHCFMRYVTISWELQSTTVMMYQPSSFNVQCFNDELQHTINLVVSNKTFATKLGGLLPSATHYICCISAQYGSDDYVLDEICIRTHITTRAATSSTCTSTETLIIRGTPIPSDPHLTSDFDNRTSIVSGVLGFVIATLLIALAICGGALLFLLRSRSFKRSSSQLADNTATEMAASRNISCSYVTAPSHSTARGAQAVDTTGQSGTSAVAEYSRIGPSYETINSRRHQPVAGKNQVSARLSERYKLSETHLAAAGGSGGQGETTMDYEVPLNTGQHGSEHHEEYSRLQH